MKRILGLLLLVLTLCGCIAARQEETTAPPAETTLAPIAPTEPAGIYVPFSDLEIQTGGTVRYFLPEEDCYGIRMMGSDVLAFSGTDTTTLTRLPEISFMPLPMPGWTAGSPRRKHLFRSAITALHTLILTAGKWCSWTMT